MNTDNSNNANPSAGNSYSDDDALADAKILEDLADQLDKEADEIDQIVAESGQQIIDETAEERAAIEKAAQEADEIEEQIGDATGQSSNKASS